MCDKRTWSHPAQMFHRRRNFDSLCTAEREGPDARACCELRKAHCRCERHMRYNEACEIEPKQCLKKRYPSL